MNTIADDFIAHRKTIVLDGLKGLKGEMTKGELAIFEYAFSHGMSTAQEYFKLVERVCKL